MKRRAAYYIVLILLILLALVTVGLLVYDLALKNDTSSISRAVIILIGIGLALAKLLIGGGNGGRVAYDKLFGHVIGPAYQNGPDAKKFRSALGAFTNGRYKSAIKTLSKLYSNAKNRDDAFASAFFIGVCYDDMRADLAAIEWYNRALSHKRHTTALSNLGICYKRMGKLDDAVAAYEEAMLLDPENANPYVNLANIYISKEEYEKALELTDTAVRLNGTLAAAYSARAVCFAMLGDRESYNSALRSYALYGGNSVGLDGMVRSMGAPIFD